MTAPQSRGRCAIYTRKSSEEGLDQTFNSLHAQREACEAYILSQKHEGWQLLPTEYDDGGFSGGNMEHPGLKKLLADITAGKIDTVVVYKVDRLTRSLSDFARIVESFDSQGVSFVSVTQQFDTTSSMNRLTLNVLLSQSYEVGYGKPPKCTRFQKGVSGNPKGRPKKAPDFDAELIRESKSLITINDNGRRTRISKFQGIVKQLTNEALTGNISALRMFFAVCQPALERAALSAEQQCGGPGKWDDPTKLTDEELERIILASKAYRNGEGNPAPYRSLTFVASLSH
jgi:predicted site-specific integrase-resolvase